MGSKYSVTGPPCTAGPGMNLLVVPCRGMACDTRRESHCRIRILHRVISCVATCGVYWMLYFALVAFRYVHACTHTRTHAHTHTHTHTPCRAVRMQHCCVVCAPCALSVRRSLVLVIFIPLTAPMNTNVNADAIAAAGFLIASLVQIIAVSAGSPLPSLPYLAPPPVYPSPAGPHLVCLSGP